MGKRKTAVYPRVVNRQLTVSLNVVITAFSFVLSLTSSQELVNRVINSILAAIKEKQSIADSGRDSNTDNSKPKCFLVSILMPSQNRLTSLFNLVCFPKDSAKHFLPEQKKLKSFHWVPLPYNDYKRVRALLMTTRNLHL